VRAAIELCGVDRVVFGSDFGPVPYRIREQVKSVEEVLQYLADREWVFWKTSNRMFPLRFIRYRFHQPSWSSSCSLAERSITPTRKRFKIRYWVIGMPMATRVPTDFKRGFK